VDFQLEGGGMWEFCPLWVAFRLAPALDAIMSSHISSPKLQDKSELGITFAIGDTK
jgi:hypothetical protein